MVSTSQEVRVRFFNKKRPLGLFFDLINFFLKCLAAQASLVCLPAISPVILVG